MSTRTTPTQEAEPNADTFSSLNDDCMLSILSFFHHSDLNSFALCSRRCRKARSFPSLDQTRTGVVVCSETRSILYSEMTYVRQLYHAFDRGHWNNDLYSGNRTHLRVIAHRRHWNCDEGLFYEAIHIVDGYLYAHGTGNIQLTGVTHLDLSCRPRDDSPAPRFVIYALALILPNLQELDLGYLSETRYEIEIFRRYCRNLTRVTVNGSHRVIELSLLYSRLRLRLGNAVVVNSSLRIFQGPESWEASRALIAPPALSTCPLFVASLLDRQEKANNSESVFCPIELGTATVKYVGSNHQDWTTCRFLLRQNYLMEYPEETKETTAPRGFAHLLYAKAYPHDDFPNALELEFYAGLCARSDKRVLFMRVANRQERDHWVTCLNDAAQLRIEDLYDYNEGCVVGRGRYSAVYPARRRTEDDGDDDSGTACALKIIDKNELWRRVVRGEERADTIVRETSVQAMLTAKCAGGAGGVGSTFTQIRGIFETSDHFVLELELLEGMDLFRHVSSKSGVMEEDEAAQIMRDIFTSLDLMARNGIAHRNIKPANILMCHRGRTTSGGGEVSVKVANFGMAGFTGVDGNLRGWCGTPGYVAPEMWTTSVHGGYGNKVDVYSAGVTLYLLLCGYEPFYGESDAERIAANKAAIIDYPEEDWSRISLEARDLVERTLERDPMKRISAKEALEHPWIVTRAPPTVVTDSSKSLTEEVGSDAELIAPNKAAIIDYPEEDWSQISLEARDLVERTLERDPMKRISAKEALEHPWIVTRAPPTVVTDSSTCLRKFVAFLKRAITLCWNSNGSRV